CYSINAGRAVALIQPKRKETAMDPAEIDSFVAHGRSLLTAFTQAQEQLAIWSASFDQRGGLPVYGNDALMIVTLSNDLVAWLTPERKAIIADLRADM